MRILILGGGGMLGHRMFSDLKLHHDVKVTLRGDISAYPPDIVFKPSDTFERVDMSNLTDLVGVFGKFTPQVIINAVGVVKQRAAARQAIANISINALLPHQLALLAQAVGARLIHFSTDCVFSGSRGGYSEDDTPDSVDLYGRAKLLGEVSDKHCITLRTSLVGHEIANKTSLVEWFLSQKGVVRGFRKAIFSGLSTIEMTRIVRMIVEEHPRAHGIWHVSGEPIDKCSLLGLMKEHYGLDTKIVPDDDFKCDRSLDSSRFRREFSYQPPSWESMIAEMSKSRNEK